MNVLEGAPVNFENSKLSTTTGNEIKANVELTETEIKYLRFGKARGGLINRRHLRDTVTVKRQDGKYGTSSLGGICKVLRRLESKGLLIWETRNEFRLTELANQFTSEAQQ